MPPTFVADAMLLKLARWLRIFGVKCDYMPPSLRDSQIIRFMGQPVNRNKILLTQDVQLDERARRRGFKSFLVPRGIPMEEQIASILREFKLDISDFPSKTICPECNGELVTAGREEVKEKVLENVYKQHRRFWLCKNCGKIYWEGSHWKRINETARKIRELLSQHSGD
jgi:uncharacterized protein with PIN domain